MAVSGSFDWLMQRDDIINAAYRKVGKVARGQSADATQITDGAKALNAIIKQVTVHKIQFPRKIELKTTEIIAGNASKAITESGTITIISLFLRDSNGDDWPLEMIARREWNEIPDKDYVAKPTKVFVRHNKVGDLTVFFNTASDADYTLHHDCLMESDDMDTATDDLPLPSDTTLFFIFALAAYLADDTGIDINKTYRLDNKAKTLFREMKEYYERQAKSKGPGAGNRIRGCY